MISTTYIFYFCTFTDNYKKKYFFLQLKFITTTTFYSVGHLFVGKV